MSEGTAGSHAGTSEEGNGTKRSAAAAGAEDAVRVSRRTLLRTGVAAGVVGGTLADLPSIRAADPPEIVGGVFNVEPGASGGTGDVRFVLIAAGSVGESRKDAAVEALNASTGGSLSPAVEPSTGDPLFYERFSIEEIDEDAREAFLAEAPTDEARRAAAENFTGTPRIPDLFEPGRVIRGRIREAVALPPDDRRFTGEATTFPQISYGGPVPDVRVPDPDSDDPTRRAFVAQLHDGFLYGFPRDAPSYPTDARYDIGGLNGDRPTAESVRGATRSFHLDLPLAVDRGDRATLVPEHTHRAHPSLATLRAVAKRRAVLMGVAGGVLHEELTPMEEYYESVIDATQSAAVGVAGNLGPTPTDASAVGAAIGAGLGLAPVAVGAATFSVSPALVPVTVLVTEMALAVYAVWSAFNALAEFGETIEDVVESFQAATVDDLLYDAGCDDDDTEEDDDRRELDDEQCHPPRTIDGIQDNETTPFAVGELSQFQAYFGGPALARGTRADNPFDRNLATYRAIVEEAGDQAEHFGETLEAGVVPPRVRRVFSGIMARLTNEGGGLYEAERRLLGRLVTDFRRPLSLSGFETVPGDLDGDGLYEDVNGDGVADVLDVQSLAARLDEPMVQNHARAFDFAGRDPERVTRADVRALFRRIRGSRR